MIGYHEALALILAQATHLPSETIAMADAVSMQSLPPLAGEAAAGGWGRCVREQSLGRVLAKPVDSAEDLPPFDNSAMDGFALRGVGATEMAGNEFVVIGSSAAGDAGTTNGAAIGGAWEIMTGAVMPEGFDRVVPIEHVEVLARDTNDRPIRIRLSTDVISGQNLRRRGQDVACGSRLMEAGTRIEAAHYSVLAALGVSELTVVRQPRVALFNTGRELLDDPSVALQPGQIRNSNGPLLAARLRAAGADVCQRQTLGDDPRAFIEALDRALSAGCDIVISTGAVSMGRFDFVPDALRERGAEILFHKVRIRPGKPLLFARLPNGSLFFGLPGNPVSSAVGLRFFVEPTIRQMLGLPAERPLRLPLRGSAGKPVALRRHLKARIGCDRHGQLCAEVLPGQESFRIAPLLQSNGWIVIDEDAGDVLPGSLVDVYGPGHIDHVQPIGDDA